MNKQTITLTPEDKFCSGGNRDIYYYDNKTKLIKITKQDVLQHRKDRQKNNFFKKFRRLKDFDENYEDDNFYKNVKHEWFDFIPKSYGLVETNLGIGFMTENILNDDGTQTISLEKYISAHTNDKGNYIEANKVKCALYDLFYNILQTNFISRELKEFNIVVKKLTNGELKLYIIDGFGDQEFIPLSKYIPFVGRNKIFRQFNRFKNNLLKKYVGGYMKNILITGANSGLGKGLALSYANSNTNLYLIGRNIERLEETKKLCEEKGAVVFIKSIDVGNKDEMKKYFEEINVSFDIVIANAGVSGGTAGGFESDDSLYEIFNTNIFGVINTVNQVIPQMIKNNEGRIVIISSIASFRGLPTAPAYSASKACVRSYGEALNNYLKKHNVNVNVVCPGFIKTPLTDKNDFPMPFMIGVDEAVKKIRQGIEKNKKFIIFPKIVYYSMMFLNCLPFGLSDYVYSKFPACGDKTK